MLKKTHKNLRILVLVHQDLVPPENEVAEDIVQAAQWKTEYHVQQALLALGHDVYVLGVGSELTVIRNAIRDFRPHLAFNLLEEFAGEAIYDSNIVSYLELMALPYTGCNPRGLILARDKSITKKILSYHRIPVPEFFVVRKSQKIYPGKKWNFPLIVKSLTEEASLGISQSSVVNDFESLQERVQFIHERLETDAIVEEFISGRELYVGVMGRERLQVLPPMELFFSKMAKPENQIATARTKFDESYRIRNGIYSAPAELDKEVLSHIENICKRSYRALQLSAYVRFDLRMNHKNEVFIIEANPNPAIGKDEDFAKSAALKGLDYPDLIHKILRQSLSF